MALYLHQRQLLNLTCHRLNKSVFDLFTQQAT